MNPLIQLKTTPPLLIILTLLCFTLLPKAQAVSPPPPGGYPNFTTAAGDKALQSLTSGAANTAIGNFALFGVTTGNANTAVGAAALDLNNADNNTAIGTAALLFNTTGTENTATGTAALETNSTGDFNTANGAFALFSNTEGESNTAIGDRALILNTTGNSNTALGDEAGSNLEDGEGNIYIGAQVQAVDTDEVEFIRIGNDTAFASPYDTYIAGIYGRPPGANTLPVVCADDGKLTANDSSQRFKHDIKPMDKASEAILALKPVSFRCNNDSTNTPWFGLIAEDVAEVNPDLIARDKEGKPFGVRYDQVNAMLLNEFLKEHRRNEEQEKTIAELESGMTALAATVKEQASQIQKVSAQFETSKPAPQVVNNP